MKGAIYKSSSHQHEKAYQQEPVGFKYQEKNFQNHSEFTPFGNQLQDPAHVTG